MTNLRIAGPTPLYSSSYKALQKEMITHRGSAYEKLHASVVKKLRPFFGTESDIYLLTSSGTGGMEALIVNFHNPTDLILSFSCGGFGDRWASIAEAYDADVVRTRDRMGTTVDLDNARQVMEANPSAASVLIQYCETSGTVLNDIKEFSRLARTMLPNALILVDAISVLGAAPMKMDEWGIDGVVTGSQKAWSAPSGLAMIAVSARAKLKIENARMSRFYFDLRLIDRYAKRNQTPTTPAVGSLFGLEAALNTMEREGLKNVFQRHLQLRDQFRAGVEKMGLKLLCPADVASPTITALVVPEGIDAKAWSQLLREKYDTIISGGKKELEGKVIRVAHMGNVTSEDIDLTLKALEASLKELKE